MLLASLAMRNVGWEFFVIFNHRGFIFPRARHYHRHSSHQKCISDIWNIFLRNLLPHWWLIISYWCIFREYFSHSFWLLRELPSCRPFSSRHICSPRRSCLIRYIARLSGPRSIGITIHSLPLPFITSWLSSLFWFSTHVFTSVSGPGTYKK